MIVDPEDLIGSKTLLNVNSSASCNTNDNQDSKKPELYVEMTNGAWSKVEEGYNPQKDAGPLLADVRPIYKILENLFIHELESLLLFITGLATGAMLHPLLLSTFSSKLFFQGYSPLSGIVETLIGIATTFLPAYSIFLLTSFHHATFHFIFKNNRFTMGLLLIASIVAFVCSRKCEALGESMRYRYTKNEIWWLTESEDYDVTLDENYSTWKNWNIARFASCFTSSLCLFKISRTSKEGNLYIIFTQ